ncbi:MAG: hypothetical protein JXR95_16675 [Deltaproteobacteria bacterium]|nr:hypothetical protein [Deltaproteobacteria bacterium]
MVVYVCFRIFQLNIQSYDIKHPVMKRYLLFSLLVCFQTVFTVGCTTPEGSGVVEGEFFILGCEESDNYGSVTNKAYFDMMANFFVGEPVLDESAVPRNHRFDIRMQRGSNTLADTDVLYIQITRAALAARLFSQGLPLPVGPDENVSATLGLYLTCPSFYDGPDAYYEGDACPVLTIEEQNELCSGVDYGTLENSFRVPQAPFSKGQSCIILCQFGSAVRGQEIPDDFKIDFGDTVSGIYFFTLGNRRALYTANEICGDGLDNDGDGTVDEDICDEVTAGGFVQGNFEIKVIRAKAIQSFP